MSVNLDNFLLNCIAKDRIRWSSDKEEIVTIGVLSFFVNFFGVFPYVKGIVWGNIRPERMTWFIWSVITGLSLLGYRELGAEDSLWFVFGDFFVTFLVFVLSLFRGSGGWTKFDLACFAVALIGLSAWRISENPVQVFTGTITADIMGLLPTLRKALQNPMSEGASTFIFSSIAAAMGFVAVGMWSWPLMFYPIYLFLANGITAQTILVGQYQTRRKDRVGRS